MSGIIKVDVGRVVGITPKSNKQIAADQEKLRKIVKQHQSNERKTDKESYKRFGMVSRPG